MNTNANVYIIDDDKDDQEMLTEALQEIDPTILCFTANNGDEGLKKLFGRIVPTPLIIFLDLNMPRVNGKEALTKIKGNLTTASIPVIIYSTSGDDKEMAEVKELGADDYLVKDFDFVSLKLKVTNLLRKFAQQQL